MLASTVPTETSLSLDSIKEILDGFEPEALLPEMSSVLDKVQLCCRIAIIIGPVILLLLGLAYLFLAPKEANYYFGYRTYFGMGSVQAWRYTQRVAGMAFGGLGLVLTVVMGILALSLTGSDAMAMVWQALRCLIWQAVLVLLVTLGINFSAMYFFDSKGEARKHPARTPKQKK